MQIRSGLVAISVGILSFCVPSFGEPLRLQITHNTRISYDRPVATSDQIVRLVPRTDNGAKVSEFKISVWPEGSTHRIATEEEGRKVVWIKLPGKTQLFEYRTSFEFLPHSQSNHPSDKATVLSAKDRAEALASQESGTEFGKLVAWLKESGGSDREKVVAAMRRILALVKYSRREQEGILSPEDTLRAKEGSCRDTTVLLIHTLRQCGIPSRFTSGYLVSNEGAEKYELELHAWCEVYLTDTGWTGFDSTSGEETGAFHIPLYHSYDPAKAGVLDGLVEICVPTQTVEMSAAVIKETASSPPESGRTEETLKRAQ